MNIQCDWGCEVVYVMRRFLRRSLTSAFHFPLCCCAVCQASASHHDVENNTQGTSVELYPALHDKWWSKLDEKVLRVKLITEFKSDLLLCVFSSMDIWDMTSADCSNVFMKIIIKSGCHLEHIICWYKNNVFIFVYNLSVYQSKWSVRTNPEVFNAAADLTNKSDIQKLTIKCLKMSQRSQGDIINNKQTALRHIL